MVTGAHPATLTWSDLVAAGIADNGTYTVSLKVTTTLGGQTCTNTDVATLTVTNTAPTLTLSGAADGRGRGRSSPSACRPRDPGADAVRTWTVDSEAMALRSRRSTAPRRPPPTLRSSDADPYHQRQPRRTRTASTGPVTKALTVAAARTLSGSATVNEGSSYTLTLGRGAPACRPSRAGRSTGATAAPRRPSPTTRQP